jgi:hypothetical protein
MHLRLKTLTCFCRLKPRLAQAMPVTALAD